MQNTETRRVIFRHPRGIYETVEVSGTGVFGVPYCYTETVRTPKRDRKTAPCIVLNADLDPSI